MAHMSALHDQVVRFIDEYKKNNEVPSDMKVLYDYMHARQVDWANKIKFKQDNFK